MQSVYHIHLKRALRYIEENLAGDITLDGCAAAAGYSLYHFHRIFRMIFGVPPAEYIRRRRLSVAAELMLRSDMNLDRVAEASGFSCKEVLIRAFQRVHGVSPTSYRRARNCLKLMPDISGLSPDPEDGFEVPLVPRIVALPPMTIVGYAVMLSRAEARDEIPRLWNRYNAEYLRSNILYPLPDMEEYDIGVSTRESGSVAYIAGRPVQRVQDNLGELVSMEIPARRYAVFTTPPSTHSTFVTTVQRTWDRIIREWIPSSPWPIDPSFDFECYCEASKTYIEEIYIPIMPDERGEKKDEDDT
ncbi:MAG: AraC family transcriptional regulator [Bacillota bacterium]